MAINFNGVKVISTGGAGGGASWPGDGSKLLSGDGTQVTVGSGLTFSAGQIAAEELTWPGAGSGMTAADGSLVTVGNGLSLSAGGLLSASGIRKSYIATVGDSTVSLLLHMDGANNSTTFTDRSYSPKTVTAFGNAKISTAQSKFGGASAVFDGNGDYIEFDRGADLQFGAGDFTIEGWVNLSSLASYQSIFGGYDIGLDVQNSTTLVVGYNAIGGGLMSRTVPTISTGTWYHWAMSKTSGTFRLFWNGVQAGASAVAPAMNNTVAKWVIGKNATNNSSHYLNGYVDEVRVTKGLGRYTANFTPSATTFANADGTAELTATSVGDTVYSSTGIYICTSLSPLTWKKLSVSSTITF
jgi:hypothetical protein